MVPSEVLVYAFFASYGTLLVVVFGHAARVTTAAVFAYVAGVTLSLGRYAIGGLASPDAMYYDRVAQSISRNDPVPVSAGKEGWSHLLAAVYDIFGHQPVLGLWINAVALGISVAVMAVTAARLGLPRKPTAWVSALYPPFFIWGTLLLRESIVWLLLAIMLFAAAGIIMRSDRIGANVSMLIVAFSALLVFRGSVALAVLVAILAAIAVSRAAGVATYAVLALALVIAFATPLADQVDQILTRYSLEQLEISREAMERTADSGFATGSAGPIFATATVLPRVLFGPFIWEFPTVGLVGTGEGMLWLVLLGCAVFGWVMSEDRRRLSLLTFPALTLILVLAVTSGNYGTMVRMRTQVALFLIPLVAVAIARLARTPAAASSESGPTKDEGSRHHGAS